ncbi:single-stranded-DNA-specific exonuclease RecJ [Nodosilinea sp. P-1105]|uniref:single-stranded-DNA-specific exonuclease RecJ n=1 Tax=Nodosilinea sp. P-1105 TaxID=2546229 RepID=UPI00146C6618|nr:single-stranded-DNA-specific exonuclease RecJ [Nodosilinea sp. P-1105]NMF85959.1 single-stranded-DNA-specific exonuclease RecJ [Nodosilinea sp. P-1105]
MATDTAATSDLPGAESTSVNLPRQRWDQPPADPRLAGQLAKATGLSPLLTQVLINRGLTTPEQAADFLEPERLQLPAPLEEFPDLAASLELLVEAIDTQQAIAICGDYDADGMTSTALLLRALRILGAKVDYTIPSRMTDGYGINNRIVETCYGDGVSLILTVDNGIAAREPIALARELGLAVIVTDHHDIPPELPPANAILNPKLLPPHSPYRGVAGVGVAYILAVCLAQLLDKTQDLTGPLLELFTLGTIADLAPLTGVNRRWVRRGLGLLPRSRLFGIQALIQVAGLADQSKPLKPEHIGFRLGPRINAVGRISDPEIVIDLLTTDDVGVALERAMQCEQINASRQDLCQTIEQEAIAWCEQQQHLGALDLQQERVLVIVQPNWHHGVIGIVASRLVERYGVPVFIGTYEDEEQKLIRGSARGIPEFDVFEALQSCHDLMEKFGGHRAAGGFSFLAKHLRQVKMRLSHYACQTLEVAWLKPLVKIDVQARLDDISQALYDQIDHLHPCGIENPDPVFWTPNVQVLEQQTVGRNRDHLKLLVSQGNTKIKAIAWRWGDYYPLPSQVDLAYKLKQNEWQGVSTIELELVGVRLPNGGESTPPLPHSPTPPLPHSASTPLPSGKPLSRLHPYPPGSRYRVYTPSPHHPTPSLPHSPSPHSPAADFVYSKRRYWASLTEDGGRQLTIGNPEGQLLVVNLGDRQGALHLPGDDPKPIDVSEVHYFNLIQAGKHATDIQQLTQLLKQKDDCLAAQAQELQALRDQVAQLESQRQSLTASQSEPASSQPSTIPHPEPQAFTPDPVISASAPAHTPDPTATAEPTAPANPKALEPQVRQAVGDQTWFCLSAATHTDLCRACHHQDLVQNSAQDTRHVDYSAAASHLMYALERELWQPLVVGVTQYGQDTQDNDMVALADGLNQAPSGEVLPPLLSESWQALSAKALKAVGKPRKDLHQRVDADDAAPLPFPIEATHRVLLDEFLQGWDHPMGRWLTAAHDEAASSLAQVFQLGQLALAEDKILRQWQYQWLQQLLLGGGRQGKGILQKIFG